MQTSIILPVELRKEVEAIAKDSERTFSQFVRFALKNEVERSKNVTAKG